MAYVTLEQFVAGTDRSRPRYALPPGTIWTGKDGHINRGGDFEKRKAFNERDELPTGTLGMCATSSDIKVFGHAASPGSLPSPFAYQRLQHPTSAGTALSEVLSTDLYNGKVYAIGRFADGNIFHFYDGTEVADWRQQVSPYPVNGKGTIARTHRRKLYSPVGSVLWFSGVDDPTLWDTVNDAGAGFNNLSSHQGGSDEIKGLITYQNYLAAFSRSVVQIWDMQDDEANNAPFQTIPGSGTRSPRTVTGFGDIDAFYLAASGVRSLRARSGTNIASVNDVGTPIDTFVIAHMRALTDTQIGNAIGLIEPEDGRFWLKLGTRIYVFSYFPSKKISAWTWYEPGVDFSEMVVYDGGVYCRSGNEIYLYGGTDSNTYDDTVPELHLPFLDMGKVGFEKSIDGFELVSKGTWNVKLLTNPNDETESEHVTIGELEGVTFSGGDGGSGAIGTATYAAPVLIGSGDGEASVSKVTLFFDGGGSMH